MMIRMLKLIFYYVFILIVDSFYYYSVGGDGLTQVLNNSSYFLPNFATSPRYSILRNN